jgi:hypothetical protein
MNEVVIMEKVLKLGKETYGDKNIHQAFQDAFRVYFSEDHLPKIRFPQYPRLNRYQQ